MYVIILVDFFHTLKMHRWGSVLKHASHPSPVGRQFLDLSTLGVGVPLIGSKFRPGSIMGLLRSTKDLASPV
jgi:hypothetical protein